MNWRAECEALGLANANLRQQLERAEGRLAHAQEEVRRMVEQEAANQKLRLDTRRCPVCLIWLPAKPAGRKSFCPDCLRARTKGSNQRSEQRSRQRARLVLLESD